MAKAQSTQDRLREITKVMPDGMTAALGWAGGCVAQTAKNLGVDLTSEEMGALTFMCIRASARRFSADPNEMQQHLKNCRMALDNTINGISENAGRLTFDELENLVKDAKDKHNGIRKHPKKDD